MRGDQKTTHRKLPGPVGMKIGHPIKGPTEKGTIMNTTRKDKKTTTMMKEQAGMVEEETEGAMEQRELEPMATGAEKHENIARRFHAWGNLL